jgi:ferritin-like protein
LIAIWSEVGSIALVSSGWRRVVAPLLVDAMGSETYHEPIEALSARTRDMHRAIVSLVEELEAIDWYQQRAEACTDQALRDVLLHNKNEEIEHAMMNLEWLRRNDPDFQRHIATYLNTVVPITEIESDSKGEPVSDGRPGGPSLGVGSLR